MAYINQDKKKIIAAALKVAMKAYPSIKYSLSIQHNSSITCRITQGPKFLDNDGKGSVDVNVYWIDSHYQNNPEAATVLNKILECLNIDNYDNSDTQTDYFDVGHYSHIEIGKWNKPYTVV